MFPGKIIFALCACLLMVGLFLPPLPGFGVPAFEEEPPVDEETQDTIKATLEEVEEAVEITIDDSGIRVRTKSGEEYSAWVDEKSRIVIGKDGVIVGDLKIPEELKEFGAVIVEEEDGEDIIKVGQDIIVGEGEKVTGDIIALWGDVTVKGTVNGTVFALDGDIYVTSSGYIRKDATSVGGEIEVEPGGQIHGEEVEVVKFPGGGLADERLRLLKEAHSAGRLGFAIVALVFIFIAITVILSLMPRNVERIKHKISEEFLKSFLFGYLTFLGVIILLIFLIITVIGIPIAILTPLFLLFSFAVGLTGMCLFLGEKVKGPMNISTSSPFYTSFLGALTIQSLLLAAAILGLLRPLYSLAGLFTAAWVIIFFFLVAPASLGAVVLARFGAAPSSKGQVQAEEPKISPPSTPEEEGDRSSQTPES